MTLHVNMPTAGAKRPVMRLIVPIPPRASPRACLEAQIDFLLETLDHIAGDPDLEETGDLEPYLAGGQWGSQIDLEEDDCDKEPSLGSLDRAMDQIRWAQGGGMFGEADRELDRSDYEDGGDTELNGDENDDDGDTRDDDGDLHEYSGDGHGEDDAIFPHHAWNGSERAAASEARKAIKRIARRRKQEVAGNLMPVS